VRLNCNCGHLLQSIAVISTLLPPLPRQQLGLAPKPRLSQLAQCWICACARDRSIPTGLANWKNSAVSQLATGFWHLSACHEEASARDKRSGNQKELPWLDQDAINLYQPGLGSRSCRWLVVEDAQVTIAPWYEHAMDSGSIAVFDPPRSAVREAISSSSGRSLVFSVQSNPRRTLYAAGA